MAKDLLENIFLLLREKTEKLQNLTNSEFTFNEEENVSTFNKREYILNLPKYKLYDLAKHYKISKYKKLAKFCLASLLLKQNNIDNILYRVIKEYILSFRLFKKISMI